MELIKHLLLVCFLPIIAALSFQTETSVIIEKKDTMKISSKGNNNKVVINTIHLKDSLNDFIVPNAKGVITQSGKNNSVQIQTKSQTQNNKSRVTNNKKPATIKISQTGKNNKVKINSR